MDSTYDFNMKREIKFRAWDVDKKIWLTEDETYKQVENQARWNPELGGHFVLMQFTGLKDKNGKEIYEGDLLRSEGIRPWSGNKYGEVAVCEWDSEYANFKMKKVDGYGETEMPNGESWALGVGKYFEVIGNIYENPELLKENSLNREEH